MRGTWCSRCRRRCGGWSLARGAAVYCRLAARRGAKRAIVAEAHTIFDEHAREATVRC